MRLAIIHWDIRSVGGIATRVNTYRRAAIQVGDTCDILMARDIGTPPKLFPQRKRAARGDGHIWTDGNVPYGKKVQQSLHFIHKNYDAVAFSHVCPHPSPTCKEPTFLRLYEGIKLPKVAFVSDGFWNDYASWGELCLPHLKAVTAPLQVYADQLTNLVDVKVIPFPFMPDRFVEDLHKDGRSRKPLVVWPHQWKTIKGINEFISIVPQLDKNVQVELYSSGIRYYQLRKTDTWKQAVGEDEFSEYNGKGRATYYGDVELDVIAGAYCRAWLTVGLQGMQKTHRKVFQQGMHNNSEVEALYYGACPILHESVRGTKLPQDCYLTVKDETEIPDVIHQAIESGFALSSERQRLARNYVRREHWAVNRYLDLKQLLFS